MSDEKYIFSAGAKKNLFIGLAAGLVLVVIGIVMMNMGGHHEEAGHAVEVSRHGEGGGHHAYHWTHRVFANLWINNLYFTGLAIIGVFFIAIQYVAQAGWSVGLKRIPMGGYRLGTDNQ